MPRDTAFILAIGEKSGLALAGIGPHTVLSLTRVEGCPGGHLVAFPGGKNPKVLPHLT
jgi:hypothetical protein